MVSTLQTLEPRACSSTSISKMEAMVLPVYIRCRWHSFLAVKWMDCRRMSGILYIMWVVGLEHSIIWIPVTMDG